MLGIPYIDDVVRSQLANSGSDDIMEPMVDGIEPFALEQRRNKLLQSLDSCTNPVDFARFQAELAAEIIEN
jgi:hypothetical protein